MHGPAYGTYAVINGPTRFLNIQISLPGFSLSGGRERNGSVWISRISNKGAQAEKVESLIYMRFRGRPHSHKRGQGERESEGGREEGRRTSSSYQGTDFDAAIPFPRLFSPRIPGGASTLPMLIDLDFSIILA